MIRQARFTLLLSLAGLQMLALGCAQTEPGGQLKQNRAPTVWLSGRPPEGSLAEYRLHLFWGGWDPDGRIAHYEYLITNNVTGVFAPCDTAIVSPCPGFETPVWNTVAGNDSIFQFSADALLDTTILGDGDTDQRLKPYEFQRSHTFFIRAVDEFGARSKEPTYISFTSRTLSPVINITVPVQTGLNVAVVPPVTTFRWEATDFISSNVEIQDPDSVRWLLISTERFGLPPFAGDEWANTLKYIRLSPDAPEWSGWVDYGAPEDSGRTWTTPALGFGNYMFAMQAKDEAGAVTPVFDERFNVRRLFASLRSSGPILTVSNRFLGTLVTATTKSPLVIADLPAGVPMSFEFEATAESYGGIVAGYRYGWDILDLNDDEEWFGNGYTPFVGPRATSLPRTFFFGSHTFHIEVIDNSGFKSRIGVIINIIPFTMENDLLFVDDILEPPVACGWGKTKGGAPCDSERDAFWADMFSELASFVPANDIIELNIGGVAEVPLRTFAKYKAVIWNANGTHNASSGAGLSRVIIWIDPTQTVGGGKTSPNICALYMAAGGKLMLVGQEVMTMVVNFGSLTPAYPLIFRYELGGDQELPYSTGDGNFVGDRGIGEQSFAYSECCLNVLDISKIQSPTTVRNPNTASCAVHLLRDHDIRTDGLRDAIPASNLFPPLSLRPEAAGDPTRFYHESHAGLVNEIYNPRYFHIDVPECRGVVEFLLTPRSCIQPIYKHGCLNTSSKIYNQMIAYWSLVYANRIPDAGGIPARSAIWGFDPVFFNPAEVQKAMDIILYDEWQLDRIPSP